jgi:hypothetical protein
MNQRGRILTNTVFIFLYTSIFIAIAAQNVHAERYFFIERPKLGLRFSYEFETEKRTGQDIDTDDTFHEFREGFDIETKGWVYHPALLTFRLGFRPELNQTIEERDPGDNDKNNGFLAAYSLDATFLQSKPYTLHLFGQRYESTLRSAFTERSDTKVDTYGANLMFKYRVLPTTLSYVHRSSEQRGFFDSDEDSDQLRMSMRHSGKKSDTRLDANYNDTERKISGTTTRTKNSNNYIQNFYDFTGGKRRVVLNSYLSYRWTESDSTDTSDFRVTENLDWRHRENLRSHYRASYEKDESGDFDRETTSFDARLTHLLYENLTTTAAGRASLSDFTEGSENNYGGNLNFDYLRRIPWGTLNLTAGWDYQVTERDLDTNDIQVIDEPHVLIDTEVTLLDNQNVDVSTIVVTDITRTIVYVENVDYEIFPRDTFTQIRRIPGGGIADGQTVLVSYTYFTSFDDSIFSQSYGVSLELWSALTLFYRFSHAKQDILSGTSLTESIDDTINTAGMQLTWRWTETTLDYEDADITSGLSTETWRASETLIFRPLRQLYFKFSGYYGNRRFKDSGDTEKFYGWGSKIDWLLTRWCKLGVEGFQNIVSGKSEKTTNTQISTILEMSYGIWSGVIKYEFIDEDDQVSDQRRTNHTVFVEFVRALW